MSAAHLRPQSVSRALAKAGFERAEAETTSIRGHYRYSPGYQVRGARAAWENNLTNDPVEDAVYVEVQTINSFDHGEAKRSHNEVVADLAPKYEQALREAGFAVERVTDRSGRFRALRVAIPTSTEG